MKPEDYLSDFLGPRSTGLGLSALIVGDGAPQGGIGSLPSTRAGQMPTAALPMGIEQRQPFPSEAEFFRANPHVGGMAAEDDRVVLNPFSSLSPAELRAVAMNEAARIAMRKHGAPSFYLTPEQSARFGSYGTPEDQRSTVAARILSGDPSAGQSTAQQDDYVRWLRDIMGLNSAGP